MPEGFEPHTQLERLQTFQQFRAACMADGEEMKRLLDAMIFHSESEAIRLDALKTKLAYAYGRPAQQMSIRMETGPDNSHRSSYRVPENGRNLNNNGPVIDAEPVILANLPELSESK